jgi:hypothetical protein
MESAMERKLIFPALMLALAILGCSIQINTTDLPPSPEANAATPLTGTGLPSLTPPSGLTVEMLRNGSYMITDSGSLLTIRLVNGSFTSGIDPAATGYISVTMGNMVAIGDLNFDGQEDAAVVLGVNTGGTGVFTSIAAVLNLGGAPVHAASVYIDDRPIIGDLMTIVSGEIIAQATIHGENDPMCCPSLPVELGYRLYNANQLVQTRRATWSGGSQRAINITSPTDLAEVSYPFDVSGGVTVGPFENTLAYFVYNADNAMVTNGPVMTDSPDAGLPGNFSLPVNLDMAGVFGMVRVEFAELSMKDGSVITLDSVLVNVH